MKLTNITLTLLLSLAPLLAQEKSQTQPVSRYTDSVASNEYKKTRTPKNPTLSWDFSSSSATYTYAYSQKVHMKASQASMTEKMGQDIDGTGTLHIKSHGNGTADLSIVDLKAVTTLYMGDDVKSAPEQEIPDMSIEGIKEDGTGDFEKEQQSEFLKLLFPLPSSNLTPGQSAKVPSSMPFTGIGKNVMIKGYSDITLTRYVKIDGKVCAQFDVEINISEMELPDDIEGTIHCSTTGISRFYFDVTNRTFVSGKVAFLIAVDIDIVNPLLEHMHEVDTTMIEQMPKRLTQTMLSDNYITVELQQE